MIITDERNPVVARFPDRELRVLGEITHVYNDPAGKPCGMDFVFKNIYIGPRLGTEIQQNDLMRWRKR